MAVRCAFADSIMEKDLRKLPLLKRKRVRLEDRERWDPAVEIPAATVEHK